MVLILHWLFKCQIASTALSRVMLPTNRFRESLFVFDAMRHCESVTYLLVDYFLLVLVHLFLHLLQGNLLIHLMLLDQIILTGHWVSFTCSAWVETLSATCLLFLLVHITPVFLPYITHLPNSRIIKKGAVLGAGVALFCHILGSFVIFAFSTVGYYLIFFVIYHSSFKRLLYGYFLQLHHIGAIDKGNILPWLFR